MGGYRAFAEPRAQTNWFDEQNGNKYCNSESDFNVARQVLPVRGKTCASPFVALLRRGMTVPQDAAKENDRKSISAPLRNRDRIQFG